VNWQRARATARPVRVMPAAPGSTWMVATAHCTGGAAWAGPNISPAPNAIMSLSVLAEKRRRSLVVVPICRTGMTPLTQSRLLGCEPHDDKDAGAAQNS